MQALTYENVRREAAKSRSESSTTAMADLEPIH